ncbi:MAG: zinc finger protein, partial [Actinomycetota bacterium]|nr:zinc finger protein [Actinomycetota bacterium]
MTPANGRPGVRGALSQLLVAANRATGDGTWARVKICAADDCAWAFFDATKNRS